MSKLSASSTLLITLLTAVNPIAPHMAWAQNRPLQTGASLASVYELDQVAMDSWTEMLAKGSNSGTDPLSLSIQLNFHQLHREGQLFEQLKTVLARLKMTQAEDYHKLAKELILQRQKLRMQIGMNDSTKRDALYMLELMAEEALYVASVKFPNESPKEFIWINESLKPQADSANLREIPVQTSDVILSKSTGFGSSSLISLVGSHGNIFSHSTPAFVNERGELLSPEADIEDGVKLRSLIKDYITGSKTRLMVYRVVSPDGTLLSRFINGVKMLVQQLVLNTNGEPMTKAGFKYGFSMQVTTNPAQDGLFCSAVAQYASSLAGISDGQSPYPRNLRSQIPAGGRGQLLKALNITATTIPAPGDLELNSLYQLAGMRIDISKLEQERVENAIIDSFFKILDENREHAQKLSETLAKIGNGPIDISQIKALLATQQVPPALAEKLSKLDAVPEGINIKQLIFFGLLNEKITPKIRTDVMAAIALSKAKGQILGLQALRTIITQQLRPMMAEVQSTAKTLTDSLARNSGPAPRCAGALL